MTIIIKVLGTKGFPKFGIIFIVANKPLKFDLKYAIQAKIINRWHGKVPNIRFSWWGILDFVEECGLNVKTH